jgi:hypothetical protein
MMKNYMTTGTFGKGKRPKGDSTGKDATPSPEENSVMSIYDGPAPPWVMAQAQAYWPSNQRHKRSGPRVTALVRVPDHF